MDLAVLKKHQVSIGLGVAGLAVFLISRLFEAESRALPTIVGGVLGVAGIALALTKTDQGPSAATLPPSTAGLRTEPISDAERQQILQNRLAQLLASGHGRIESMTPYAATLISGQKVNHILHLLISVFTFGVWLPVWFYISLSGGENRHVIAVDACGNINRA